MRKRWYYLLLAAMMLLPTACDDDIKTFDTDMIEIPGNSGAIWVKDQDISQNDLKQAIDFAALVETMRLEYIKLMSNGYADSTLFCGIGNMSNTDNLVDAFTKLQMNSEEYEAALKRLQTANLLTPTVTRGTDISNLFKILTAAREETATVQEKVQAARLAAKVAVATAALYYPSMGRERQELLQMLKKATQGKTTWQDINTVVTNKTGANIKTALKDLFGDDATEVLVNKITKETCDYLVGLMTAETGAASGPIMASKLTKGSELAVINIDTGTDATQKTVIVRDNKTGKVYFATTDEQGLVTVPVSISSVTVTVIDKNGNRATETVDAKEGSNYVKILADDKYYLYSDPTGCEFEATEDVEDGQTVIIQTNCRYLKFRKSENADWLTIKLQVSAPNTQSQKITMKVAVKENKEANGRTATITLDGYKKKDDPTSITTCTIKVTQKGAEE